MNSALAAVAAAPPRAKQQAGQGIANKSQATVIGRLTNFGIKETWQIPLLLPNKWDDFTTVITTASGLAGRERAIIHCSVAGYAKVSKTGNRGIPYVRLPVRFADGSLSSATNYGDVNTLSSVAEGAGVGLFYLAGKVRHGSGHFAGDTSLEGAELVHQAWAGRLRPVYPGLPRVMKPETVRDRVVGCLRTQVPLTAAALLERLAPNESDLARIPAVLGIPMPGVPSRGQLNEALCRLILTAHVGRTVESAMQAQAALERLAAFAGYRSAFENGPSAARSRWIANLNTGKRLQAIPFELSKDQLAAIGEISRDIAGKDTMRRLLSGDVGSGKTAVYASVVAAAVDQGAVCAVMLPSETLARQVHRDMRQWWPDLANRLILRTGSVAAADTKSAPADHRAPLPCAVIGTTALLHDERVKPQIVVVDEQHKFSREQREQLLARGAHLLEVTATCIPRSQALVQFGVLTVSKLRPHVRKVINTRIVGQDERRELMASVVATLEAKHQVLVVYPARGDGSESESDDLPTATEAFQQWDRLFPGRVALAHGGQSGSENDRAVGRMRDGSADILVATSVVEVGVNIPGLRHVVVVRAERFGLTSLHQIRGRAARTGGVGTCDLYLPKQIGEKSYARLQALVRHQDGFELAEADMRLRGIGDLSSSSDMQSGADDTFLFGRPLSIDRLNEVVQALSPDAIMEDQTRGAPAL